MTTAPKARSITPTPGYVVKGLSRNGQGKIFINICSHPIVGRPQDAMDREVSDTHLIEKGIESLRVPQFAGLPRKVPDLGTVVDVMFHPAVVERALNGPEKNVEYFKNRLTELAVPFVHQDTNGMVSMNVQTIQFLRNSEYKGGVGPKGKTPISISVELGDDEEKPPPKKEDGFLIEEVSSTRNKPAASGKQKKSTAARMKGFFDKAKPEDSLYGPEGSNEGVVPDGAGDPLGYLPKGLRDRCKVVDSSKLNQEEQNTAMQQYATTGTVDPKFTGSVEENARKEAANAQYWEEKKRKTAAAKAAHAEFNAAEQNAAKEGGKSSVKKGFFDHVKGPGLYGEGGSTEGDTSGAQKKKPLKMPSDLSGMEQLMQNGGFDNMDFDGFMEAMNMNDIDPGEFASQMRDLADVIMPEEGGAAKIDEDVRKLVEQVADEHVKNNYDAQGKRKPGAPKGLPKDIWGEDELPVEEEATMEVDTSLPAPKHSMKVLKGDDLGDDKLEVRVQMPLCESISGVDLELESTSLVLGVEGVYALKLKLKKPVDEDNVQARFDKAAKELIISAPIKYD